MASDAAELKQLERIGEDKEEEEERERERRNPRGFGDGWLEMEAEGEEMDGGDGLLVLRVLRGNLRVLGLRIGWRWRLRWWVEEVMSLTEASIGGS